MLKSSYNLEFLGIRRALTERALEDRLIERLRDFILELGYGFCFIGRQHRLSLGKKEYFIDLLFYHRFLKALVAFELNEGQVALCQTTPRRSPQCIAGPEGRECGEIVAGEEPPRTLPKQFKARSFYAMQNKHKGAFNAKE